MSQKFSAFSFFENYRLKYMIENILGKNAGIF